MLLFKSNCDFPNFIQSVAGSIKKGRIWSIYAKKEGFEPVSVEHLQSSNSSEPSIL